MKQLIVLHTLATVCLAVAWLPAAHGQVPSTVPPVAATVGGTVAAAGGFSGMAGGDLGFGSIGGDYYLRLNIGTEFDFGQIGVGVQIPLNFRVSNRCPAGGDCGLNNTLRKEDWDEVSDYARIIRYFRYGRPNDTFYLRVGELGGATLGHGTIVNGYYNSVNVDIYKLGVQFNVNTSYGGVQTLMDNLLQPKVFGLRGYVRPVSFWDPKSYANNLALGVTFMMDAFAPVGAALGAAGSSPAFAEEAATMLGFDAEFTVLQHKIIDVIPYTDINKMFGAGTGWHLGVLTKLRPLENFGLNLRLEYRYLGEGYLPGYFDSYYDIMKYQFPGQGSSQAAAGTTCPTKYDFVRGRGRAAGCDVGVSGSGIYAEGVFDFFKLLTVIIAYEDASGPNNSNLLLSLQLPMFEAIKLAAYYQKRFFEGLSNAFSLENAVLVAEAKVRMYSILYLIARYNRSWRLGSDGTSFVSTDDFTVGIGVQARF